MSWQKLSVRIILISFLAVVALSVAAYLVLGREAVEADQNRLLDRQRLLVRAEANNLVTFVDNFGHSMVVLAKLSSMNRRDHSTLTDMEIFVDQWRDSSLLGGIILTDNQGQVEFNATVSGISDVGENVADRDYFVWAKNHSEGDEYFVDKPVISRLGETEGRVIVPIAAVVHGPGGGFEGVVVAAIRLEVLTKNFLELFTVSETTEVYLINAEGKLIYSNMAVEAVGDNLFERVYDRPFFGSEAIVSKLRRVLTDLNEGTERVTYAHPQTKRETTYLIAYSPVRLGAQNWLLVMASPAQDLLATAASIGLRFKILLVLLSLTLIIYGMAVRRVVEGKYPVEDQGARSDQNKL